MYGSSVVPGARYAAVYHRSSLYLPHMAMEQMGIAIPIGFYTGFYWGEFRNIWRLRQSPPDVNVYKNVILIHLNYCSIGF